MLAKKQIPDTIPIAEGFLTKMVPEVRNSSLREQQYPTIRKLAGTIESLWQEQLVLSPYATPTDLGYVEGSLEGERLTIENHCYQTPQFRKLHLELAQIGKNLDILHCVMFPRPDFNLPIFGVDIVAGRGQISAAIVDLSPVSSNRSLPVGYEEALSQLPPAQFSQPRELPAWGRIFSDFCLFMRPTAQEEDTFINQVSHYLSIHCQLAREATAVSSSAERDLILLGQRHYCSQQQKNDKTRRVLENAFGEQWADRYVRTMLFDA